MNSIMVDKLELEGRLDGDGEMGITVGDSEAFVWIDRNDALRLVRHLVTVFDLTEAIKDQVK